MNTVRTKGLIIGPLLAALALVWCGNATAAAEYQRIQNRWKSDQYIHIESGMVAAGKIDQTWRSAQWTIEPVPGDTAVRISNRWKPDRYLHIERGQLQAGPIQSQWSSAKWTIEVVPGESYARIRNRWKSDRFLHIERGKLEAGPIQTRWKSAQWSLTKVGGGSGSSSSSSSSGSSSSAGGSGVPAAGGSSGAYVPPGGAPYGGTSSSLPRINVCVCESGCGNGYIGGTAGDAYTNVPGDTLKSYLDFTTLQAYPSQGYGRSGRSGWFCTARLR